MSENTLPLYKYNIIIYNRKYTGILWMAVQKSDGLCVNSQDILYPIYLEIYLYIWTTQNYTYIFWYILIQDVANILVTNYSTLFPYTFNSLVISDCHPPSKCPSSSPPFKPDSFSFFSLSPGFSWTLQWHSLLVLRVQERSWELFLSFYFFFI